MLHTSVYKFIFSRNYINVEELILRDTIEHLTSPKEIRNPLFFSKNRKVPQTNLTGRNKS